MSKRAIKKHNICMVMLLLFAVVSSCKTRYITTEVPVELHDTISVVKTVHSIDTIERVERIHTIDTMLIDTSTIATLGMPTLRHNRTTMIDNTLKQSHHADTTNTIERIIEKPVVVKETEYVETNVLHWWQSALMWLGGVCFIALCGTILIKILHKHA